MIMNIGYKVGPSAVLSYKESQLLIRCPTSLQPTSLYLKIQWGMLFRSICRRCTCYLSFSS